MQHVINSRGADNRNNLLLRCIGPDIFSDISVSLWSATCVEYTHDYDERDCRDKLQSPTIRHPWQEIWKPYTLLFELLYSFFTVSWQIRVRFHLLLAFDPMPGSGIKRVYLSIVFSKIFASKEAHHSPAAPVKGTCMPVEEHFACRGVRWELQF